MIDVKTYLRPILVVDEKQVRMYENKVRFRFSQKNEKPIPCRVQIQFF